MEMLGIVSDFIFGCLAIVVLTSLSMFMEAGTIRRKKNMRIREL